jgi:hypothetical protein
MDKDGDVPELVNVVRFDPKTGKKVRPYVDLRFAGFEDVADLLRHRSSMAHYVTDERDRFLKIGCERRGRKFQKLFQFDPPADLPTN